MKVFEGVSLAILFTIITVNGDNESEDPCYLVPDNAFIADRSSCTGWIRCNDGKSNKGNCPDGLRFNSKAGTCANNVACKDDICEEGSDGKFFVDDRLPRRCSAYFYCHEGIAESYDCPDGLYFDGDTNECDYKENVMCENDEADEDIVCALAKNDILLRNLDSCEKYWKCNDGKGVEQKCEPQKLYNHKLGKCDDMDKVSCEVFCKKDDKKKKNPKSCRSYYECNDENASLVKCKLNELVLEKPINEFECVDQMEVSDEVCQNRCEGRKSGFVPAYDDNVSTRCSKYHPCKDGNINGKTTVFTCPDKMFLNVDEQKCVYESFINRTNCRHI